MRAASPSCSAAGQPFARFSSRYRPHALLLLPLLLLGHFLVSRGVPADDVQYGSASNPHTRLLRRLSRSHFSHPPHHPPPVADFTESDGYLYYHDNAPSVTVIFPDGATLNAEIPPSTSADPSSAQDAQGPVPGSDDGLLRKRDGAAGQPKQLHPITHLIREAEVKWDAMLARQSNTLKAAVLEYRRRYRREPPIGFDAWWRFARRNKVILVDEYDQINTDIEPFLSFEASNVFRRVLSIVKDGGTSYGGFIAAQSVFAIEIKDGEASILRMPQVNAHRALEYLGLINRFAADLPDMLIPFSIEDGPSVLVSGEAKQRHLDYARNGRKYTSEQADEVVVDKAWTPWASVCPPRSQIRRLHAGQVAGQSSVRPSFVSTDHYDAADTCKHGENAMLHGTTLTGGYTPQRLFPIISFSKTSMHSDILGTPMDQYGQHAGDWEWEHKFMNKVLWRGGTTGIWHSSQVLWKSSQRPRLVSITNDNYGMRTVLIADPTADDAMRSFTAPTADINEHLFDVALHPAPLQCNNAPGLDETCSYMERDLKFDPQPMTFEEANMFKYVLDVDGNAWSGRFHRLMSSRSLVFKSTMYPEWYSKRIMPWYHYVPIKADYSDLHHAAAYFVGLPDGTGSHDDVGKRLGENGARWTAEHWREEDMAAYQFRLYLELARAMYGVAGSHDFVLDDSIMV